MKLDIRIKYCLSCIMMLFLLTVSFAYSQNAHKNILVIHSYHIGYTWNDSISSGILSVTNKEENVDVFVEFLDGKRYEDSVYFSQLFHIFEMKYKKGMFDLVILSDNLALDFSLKYGKSLFGDVPVVYCGVKNLESYNLANLPYYGVLETEQDEIVLRQIITMFPDLKNMYLISDKTQSGITDMARVMNITKKLPSSIQYHFIDDIYLDTLLAQAHTFKTTDAVFLISLQRDKYGHALNYGRVTSKFCAASPAPVFCSYFSNIGKGVVGGCFVNATTQGRLSAEIALNILFKPNYIPKKLTIPLPEYFYDNKVLTKFSIPKKNLPANSKIINLPENVYDKYKVEITIIFSAIVFLIFIIILLLKNIQRRLRAEKEVSKQYIKIQKQNTEITDINQNLNDTNAELEIVNEALEDINKELFIAKEKAEESDRLKTAFLHNMSHEIRTPMHAIMCFSELMMTNYSKKEELEKYIQLINQHCNDLLLIINDILDIAKIESGQASVNIEECRVNDIFSELVAYFTVHQTKIGKPSIKFVANNANNIQFNTDRIKLKQILINLISNAFKFTEQGKIEVSCFVLINNEVQFIVEDTGIGIPDDKQAFVFTRFAQVENSNTRLYRGTGLGLPIVEGLVALLGGVITLQSELGKGSKFIFKLPSNI